MRSRFLRRHGPGGGGVMDIFLSSLLTAVYSCSSCVLKQLSEAYRAPRTPPFFLPFTSPLITPHRLNVSERGGLGHCTAEEMQAKEDRGGRKQVGLKIPYCIKRFLWLLHPEGAMWDL